MKALRAAGRWLTRVCAAFVVNPDLPRTGPTQISTPDVHAKAGHWRWGAQHESIFNIAMEIAESWPRQRNINRLKTLTDKFNSVLEAHFAYEVQELAFMGFPDLEARKAEQRVMLDELRTVRTRLSDMEFSGDLMGAAFMVQNLVLGTAGYLSHGGIYSRAYTGANRIGDATPDQFGNTFPVHSPNPMR